MGYEAVFQIAALGEVDFTATSWTTVMSSCGELDARTESVAQVGALVALGASETSFSVVIDSAISAGVDVRELAGVLVALGPLVGSARLIAAASAIAPVLGIDIDGALEPDPRRRPSRASE